jgi:heat shock protein HtpX
MMSSSGLQSHIWDNNLRSLLFLAAYPLIIIALVCACAYVFAALGGGGMLQQNAAPLEQAGDLIAAYWPMILTVVLIWFGISFFFNTAMIRALSHAHPVSRAEEPALYNMLENLSISRGMKMPQLNIIETHARNAFASGIDERSYTVTVTRGLMNSLKADELEGVLAHELTHIINRDVRLLMITVVFTGMVGFAAQLVWSSVRWSLIAPSYNRRQDGGQGGIVMALLAVAAVLWIGYFATLFMRFALSRRREYMADAGAVALTKNPEAMMRALMRISGRDQIPAAPADIMMMCAENARPFMGLFATHPPIEQRIQVLSQMTGTAIPDLPHHGPAEAAQAFSDRSRANPWLVRSRGGR